MKKKIKNSTGTGRYWGETEVHEATYPLRVFASTEDANGAKPKDWANCVFAKACSRLFGSKKIAFFRRTAYIELPDETGKLHVERFILNKNVRDKIMEFDRTHIPPTGGFLLSPPSPSHTLEGTMKRKLGKPKSPKSSALIIGQRKKRRGRSPVFELEWRNGTGMVHFDSPKAISAAKVKE